ncbi:hypothetical protein LA345_12660 [Burkholderia vietnamiensis]|uniref:Uncharacterized protein n=1 Tax=Burkholderia vietnamiensis (strain G4 / LMG 22486) TaxID=269482 RepID=A4JFF2_BURVG|nr:hypothetical protein Bcep1808_2002 [Burkholderia vietnamiensis G4]MCB4344763.1 hypothetical protein [Burkholderia vietnamiensis]
MTNERNSADPSREGVVKPLVIAWDEFGLSTEDEAFDRQWSKATNARFNKLWVNVDPEIAQDVHKLLFDDYANRDLSRFGQILFRQAYLLERLLDHIENRPGERPDADIARCAVMFYAGLHFGRQEPDMWALYFPLRDAAKRAGQALFSIHEGDAGNASATESSRVAAQAWAGMDWLYAHQYLPRWRPDFATAPLIEPERFSADLIHDARDAND